MRRHRRMSERLPENLPTQQHRYGTAAKVVFTFCTNIAELILCTKAH